MLAASNGRSAPIPLPYEDPDPQMLSEFSALMSIMTPLPILPDVVRDVVPT